MKYLMNGYQNDACAVAFVDQALNAIDGGDVPQAVAFLQAALAMGQNQANDLLVSEVRYYLGALGIHRFWDSAMEMEEAGLGYPGGVVH